jgi:hypothetical protein
MERKSKFKVGDRVRVVRHRNFHGDTLGPNYGLPEGTIIRLTGVDESMSLGAFTMFTVEDLGDGFLWVIRSDDIEPINASPIRTVTRREIVPGVYGRVAVDKGGTCTMVRISVNDSMSKNHLREAAHLFNQLAEVLEENAAADKKEAA